MFGHAAQSIEQALNLYRLRWLEQMLRISKDRLPLYTLFTGGDNAWIMSTDRQSTTWRYENRFKVRQEPPAQWMEILSDRPKHRIQLLFCIRTVYTNLSFF